MGIDVDNRRQLGAAHRGRGRSEEPCRLGGDGAWAVGLDHELRAVAAAEPQERRRPEDVRIGQSGADLVERAQSRYGVGPCDNNANEVAINRKRLKVNFIDGKKSVWNKKRAFIWNPENWKGRSNNRQLNFE